MRANISRNAVNSNGPDKWKTAICSSRKKKLCSKMTLQNHTPRVSLSTLIVFVSFKYGRELPALCLWCWGIIIAVWFDTDVVLDSSLIAIVPIAPVHIEDVQTLRLMSFVSLEDSFGQAFSLLLSSNCSINNSGIHAHLWLNMWLAVCKMYGGSNIAGTASP